VSVFVDSEDSTKCAETIQKIVDLLGNRDLDLRHVTIAIALGENSELKGFSC